MASGRRIAGELGLPFRPFPEFLRQLKNQQFLSYANSSSANDYVYSLTDAGRARARMHFEECAYVGPAPVPFDDYLRSVSAQTITCRAPQGSGPARSVFRPLDRGRDVAAARAGDQFLPRLVSLRLPGQRQDEHRRADHALFRHDGLDSSRHLRRGPDSQAAGHGQSRAGRDGAIRPGCLTNRISTAAGSDQASHDRRRRRASDG